MFFTASGATAALENSMAGTACFLVLSGPSLSKLPLRLLNQPGTMTWGVNNSAKIHRPNLWTCVDSPSNFLLSIWQDPLIQKIVPFSHTDKKTRNSITGKDGPLVRECPRVLYYRRNEFFNAENYLSEDTVNWGNRGEWGGGRSVMLATIRLMHLMGIRKIFLIGCDFKMSSSSTYCFEQERSKSSVKGNNKTYAILQQRFAALRPVFAEAGLEIKNASPNSSLEAFERVGFSDAVEECQATNMSIRDTSAEPTAGLYTREAKERAARDRKAFGDALLSKSDFESLREAILSKKEELGREEHPNLGFITAVSHKGTHAQETALLWLESLRASDPEAPVLILFDGPAPKKLLKKPKCCFVSCSDIRPGWKPRPDQLRPLAVALNPYKHALYTDLDCMFYAPIKPFLRLTLWHTDPPISQFDPKCPRVGEGANPGVIYFGREPESWKERWLKSSFMQSVHPRVVFNDVWKEAGGRHFHPEPVAMRLGEPDPEKATIIHHSGKTGQSEIAALALKNK